MRGRRDIGSRLGGPVTDDSDDPKMTSRMQDLASDFMQELESTFSRREKTIPKTRTLYSDFYEEELVSETAPSTRYRVEDADGGYRGGRNRGGGRSDGRGTSSYNRRQNDKDYASFTGASARNNIERGERGREGGNDDRSREEEIDRRLGSSPSLSGSRNGGGGGRRRQGGQDRTERAEALKALDARLGLPSVDEFGRDVRD
ncbi:hypothetical protein BGZ83_000444 [Gryganskiella cystojenkinii]|nr:hypothetical protein BGZ83_000444 [Gryganskiella cystojenkinii]